MLVDGLLRVYYAVVSAIPAYRGVVLRGMRRRPPRQARLAAGGVEGVVHRERRRALGESVKAAAIARLAGAGDPVELAIRPFAGHRGRLGREDGGAADFL